MESPRSRLIVQAYLRGLTRPDYPNGIKSVVREELILAAIDSEIQYQKMMDYTALRQAILPLIKQDNRKSFVTSITNGIDMAYGYKLMDLNVVLSKQKYKNVDELIKLYKILEKIGILESSSDNQ